jgi:hypothetical protein
MEDLKEYLVKVTTSKEYPPDVKTIWDITESELGDFGFGFAFKSLKLSKRFKGRRNTKIAVVTTSAIGLAQARLYEGIAGELGHKREVFGDLESAKKWLLQNDSD